MTDDKRFFDGAAPLPKPVLSLADWETLPLATRVCDRLVEILLLASEIRTDLESEGAAPLTWIAPEIERVLEQTDEALQRLAS
jgi:hypothetical protein